MYLVIHLPALEIMNDCVNEYIHINSRKKTTKNTKEQLFKVKLI